VPLGEAGGKLMVATDDPFSVFSLDFFGARCGCPVEAALIREQDFLPLLENIEKSLAEGPPVVPPMANVGTPLKSPAAPPAPAPVTSPAPPPPPRPPVPLTPLAPKRPDPVPAAAAAPPAAP